jgi:hypothetical protein
MEKTFLKTSTFTPKIDILNQKIEIGVVEKMDGTITNHYKEIIDIKEKMIRDALIALGWTPPVASKEETMTNYRAFEIKFFEPTDTKPRRIRIKDYRFNETKWLSWDYTCNGSNQALKYLNDIGIEIMGRAEYFNSVDIFFTEDYSISIKGGAL